MAEFQFMLGQVEQAGVSVFALSTDDLEHAKSTVDKNGVTYPVFYGVDGPALSAQWGSFYEERRKILHATSFLLRPDHTIASVTYSTGPVGRITPVETARIVAFYRKQAEAKK